MKYILLPTLVSNRLVVAGWGLSCVAAPLLWPRDLWSAVVSVFGACLPTPASWYKFPLKLMPTPFLFTPVTENMSQCVQLCLLWHILACWRVFWFPSDCKLLIEKRSDHVKKSLQLLPTTLKTKCRRFDNFVVTGGTVSCRNDNLRCHKLRQSCQIDNLLFSVEEHCDNQWQQIISHFLLTSVTM